MQKLFSSGTNKKVTGKAADSGYNATKTTTPKPQVQLPNLQNLFQSNTSGTGRRVTGKAADACPQAGVQSATTASAAALGASNSGYTAAKSTPPTPRVQLPAQQNTTQNLGTIGTTKQVTGKAVDSGYTVAKKQASQAANRQTVQNALQPITFGATNQNTGKAADSGITTELRRAQQQANRQTVGNLFQGTKNSANKQNDYSFVKGTAGALQKGLQRVAEAGGNTFAFAEDAVLAPFELAFGRDLGEFSDNAPLNRWAQKIREEGDAVDAYYAENIKAGGKAAELYDSFGSSLIAALPMAAAAFYSGGTSAVASTAGLQTQAASALSPGLTQTVRDVVMGTAKNPQYWLSLFQTIGNSYENAIADMEDQNAIAQLSGGKTMDSNDIRTKAALQAAGSGLMNAAIEVSGGLQTLPKELRQGKKFWRAMANSGIDEGVEEILQGIVDRASQNSVYNKGNPLASLTDPNAVFSLPAAVNEFAGGFTVGSILGGGQAGVLSAAQAIQDSPITSYTDAFRKLMGGNKTATNANTGTTDSMLARYKELERKFLEGSISPDEADELWRLEGMKGAIGSVSTSLETLRQAKATDAFKDYLAEKIKEEYTQSEYTASEFREFDNDGTPLFAKSKETAGVQPTNLVENKKMREWAKEAFGLEKDESSRLENYVTGMLCYRLNMKMTKGNTLTYGEKEIAQSIRNAFLKFPAYSGRTYRNIQFHSEAEYSDFLFEYSVGNTVTWNGFTSTAKRPNGYPLFGNYVIHMVVDGVSGRDIADTYGIPRQQEVTYLPGAKVRVVKITTANDGCPLIYLEEVRRDD